MSGLYLHIPYCKQKCHYCDFHFSTSLQTRDEMVEALISELDQRKDYLKQPLNTIYFGGGTPSLLTAKDFEKIFSCISDNFRINSNAEITVEANPDDLDEKKLTELKSVGVNRLSIGIQSFDDKVLQWMNRAHTKQQTYNAIEAATRLGYENITVDLIYGIPDQNENYWPDQLKQFFSLNLPHLSAYTLTIESSTAFGNWARKGSLIPASDEQALREFDLLLSEVVKHDFEQYEISNFAREGYISQHNSAYWKGLPYLGIGPSAHSYNGAVREWNVANNNKYIQAIKTGSGIRETEVLSEEDKFNEMLLTRLRTKWGVDLASLKAKYPEFYSETVTEIENYLSSGHLSVTDEVLSVTTKGKFIIDAITADLFV